jgi:hypothetical protein
MERQWRRDELERMSKPELENILRNRGQSTVGFKAKLIQRILGEGPPKMSNPRKEEPKLSLEERINNLRRLDYDEVIEECRKFKELENVCDDEKFWEAYAKAFRNIKKSNPNETWKEAAKRESKFSLFKGAFGKNIDNIVWDMVNKPLAKNIKYVPVGHRQNPLPFPVKEFDKILFEKPITVKFTGIIKKPQGYKILKSYGEFDEGDLVNLSDENELEMIIEPNTPEGSTVRHILDSVYRAVWDLPENENRDIRELIEDADKILSEPIFGGIMSDDGEYYVDSY